MATAKKYPEFEGPPLLLEAFRKTVGSARMAETTGRQRYLIVQLAQHTAAKLGEILEQPHANIKIESADRPD